MNKAGFNFGNTDISQPNSASAAEQVLKAGLKQVLFNYGFQHEKSRTCLKGVGSVLDFVDRAGNNGQQSDPNVNFLNINLYESDNTIIRIAPSVRAGGFKGKYLDNFLIGGDALKCLGTNSGQNGRLEISIGLEHQIGTNGVTPSVTAKWGWNF